MRRAGWLGPVVYAVDAGVLLLALAAAWRTWLWWRPQLTQIVQIQFVDLLVFNDWMPSGLLLVAMWLLFLRQLGFYDPLRMPTAVRAAGVLSQSVLYVLLLVVAIEFFVPQRWYSRTLIGLVLGYSFLGLSLARWVLLRTQHVIPLSSRVVQPVAIVGTGGEAHLMEERLKRFASASWELVGFIETDPAEPDRAVESSRVLGQVGDLRGIVNRHDLAAVILATRSLSREAALTIATRCDHMGLRVLQVPFTWGIVSPRLRFAEIGELQLIDLSELSYPTLGQHFKRSFDIFAVLLGGLLILPVSLLVAALVWFEDRGPVFYVSPRVGRGGRAFPFFKFRSMFVGADKMKAALASRNETDGVLFKIKDDPRITRVGKVIRKYSLDEFPQFWNVLRGDMNLVGPRPLPLRDLESIGDDPEILYWFELRHKVPPGITGLWQVSGRSNLGFREMVELDIHYVQNWSPWLDLKILIMTLPAVLKGRGAS